MDKIMDTVQKLIRKTGTNDPFRIASFLNIPVLFEELGSIYGYYNMVLKMKQIHINQELTEFEQIYTCSHELGHAIMHPKANTQFLRNSTLLSVDKLEREANIFALDLRIGDDILIEHCQYSTSQLSIMLGYSEELIKMRIDEWLKIR
ncbi:ImmA/IrrE family metallo-endopeptidase [Eisenbergiella tayi]|uniref:ImmA/IrrE family metallo-endopeptidase n=1 Tax=Eisenbergiella tayi TaxID=1432052 RepID=UPI00307CAAC5